MRRRLVAVLAVGALVLGLAPIVSAADLATFGTPSAESSFGNGIDFRQPVTVSKPVGRVELLLTTADAIGPTVIEVPNPPITGASTLTHHFDEADGFLLANTPVRAQWRLIAADDSGDVQVGPEVRITYADDRFDWKTEAGDIVRVHWTEGSEAFGRRALRIAEDAVAESSKLLGVTETEPMDFYIYADENAFRAAIGPGVRENVGGLAVAQIRTLFALIPPSQIDDAWVGIVIPHELTHLVFNTASKNAYHSPPHWLNEGLADYVSQGYDRQYRNAVGDAARTGDLIPLDGLIGQFPTTSDRFYLAYAESVSAVDYMVRTHGKEALVALIRSYADGRTDDEAFSNALGVDAGAFGDAWLKDVNGKQPTRYGPQPAPAGPVPAAWGGSTGSDVASGLGAAPDWVAPVVALTGVVVIVLLVVGARRSRPKAPGW
jgi:peptidase MA superfamily protein